MKKKLNSTKNLFRGLFLSLTVMMSMFVLSGCTSLSYVGDDFSQSNSQIIQTNELFTFSTYSKTSETENIDMKVGVAKTPLPDALVVYVNIKNNSSANDYVFYLKDFEMKAGNETLSAIPPSAYLNAYQSYETGTYNGLSNIAPTLGAFADIQNAYQNVNNALNNTGVKIGSTNAVSGHIGSIVSGISEHTISTAGIVKAGNSNFFYIFLKDPSFLPIDFNYKDLKYSFGNPKDFKETKEAKETKETK